VHEAALLVFAEDPRQFDKIHKITHQSLIDDGDDDSIVKDSAAGSSSSSSSGTVNRTDQLERIEAMLV